MMMLTLHPSSPTALLSAMCEEREACGAGAAASVCMLGFRNEHCTCIIFKAKPTQDGKGTGKEKKETQQRQRSTGSTYNAHLNSHSPNPAVGSAQVSQWVAVLKVLWVWDVGRQPGALCVVGGVIHYAEVGCFWRTNQPTSHPTNQEGDR